MSTRLKDLAERSVWTFLQAFAGVWAALEITGDVDWKATLYAALIAGGIAVAKAVVAFQLGQPDSAALPETRPDA